jgi:hypothetical protein
VWRSALYSSSNWSSNTKPKEELHQIKDKEKEELEASVSFINTAFRDLLEEHEDEFVFGNFGRSQKDQRGASRLEAALSPNYAAVFPSRLTLGTFDNVASLPVSSILPVQQQQTSSSVSSLSSTSVQPQLVQPPMSATPAMMASTALPSSSAAGAFNVTSGMPRAPAQAPLLPSSAHYQAHSRYDDRERRGNEQHRERERVDRDHSTKERKEKDDDKKEDKDRTDRNKDRRKKSSSAAAAGNAPPALNPPPLAPLPPPPATIAPSTAPPAAPAPSAVVHPVAETRENDEKDRDRRKRGGKKRDDYRIKDASADVAASTTSVHPTPAPTATTLAPPSSNSIATPASSAPASSADESSPNERQHANRQRGAPRNNRHSKQQVWVPKVAGPSSP